MGKKQDNEYIPLAEWVHMDRDEREHIMYLLQAATLDALLALNSKLGE